MKHKHYDMIMAKAANMDLVVFCRDTSSESHKWDEYVSVGFEGETLECAIPAFEYGYEYFMCLPKHKEACLHWLNGGDLQVKRGDCDGFLDWDRPSRRWKSDVSLMHNHSEFRIKPHKEKRWIAIYSDGTVCDKNKRTKEEIITYVERAPFYSNCAPENWQFIEIEVEL